MNKTLWIIFICLLGTFISAYLYIHVNVALVFFVAFIALILVGYVVKLKR